MEATSEQKALVRYMIKQKGYTQLIKQYTTAYKTQIDDIYTYIPHQVQSSGTLESYYSDHKPIFVCLKVSSQSTLFSIVGYYVRICRNDYIASEYMKCNFICLNSRERYKDMIDHPAIHDVNLKYSRYSRQAFRSNS